MTKSVVMAESSDIYHDYRVQKEAGTLAGSGRRVTVYGFRGSRKRPQAPSSAYEVRTLPVVSRSNRHLRNLSMIANIGLINLRLLLTRADAYHAHNTMFLGGMWLSARLHRGVFIYDAHEVQWEHGRSLAWLEKTFIRRAQGLINVAAGRAHVVAERYCLRESDITIVANYPVVDGGAVRRPYAAPVGTVRLVYSGGYDLQSNRLDLLLRAMQRVPGIELHMIAFGYRDSEMQLKALARELGIEERVVFHGLVRPDEVMGAVSQYDVAVNMLTNPQNHLSIRHSSVNKMYEYMAAGMPTFCSDLDSFVAEFVVPGAAIAVDATDTDSIAEGLRKLLSLRESLPQMSVCAHELAREKYNWRSQETNLLDLYRRLIGEEARP